MEQEAEPVLIRAAVPEDVDALSDIERICSALPWHRTSLFQDLTFNQNAFYFVAESHSGQIVGYIACWAVQSEAEIINLAVLPSWRRQGIASRLMNHALLFMKNAGVRQVFLDVREHNEAALALYSRFGFIAAGFRAAYYHDNGENAIIMTKMIGDNDEYIVQ